ncbi:MAG: acyl carrier protein [Lachnospiraceae bacterium]|nr:acyl carrier protein [Lachnospiraceae bacterium]
MEELLELLQDVRDDIDFSKEDKLIDDKILTSFDIIQIIAAIDETFDVSIPATQIVPANFNSMQAMYDMIQKLSE